MVRRISAAILVVGLCVAIAGTKPIRSQDDLAYRQLENGDRLARDGKLQQARDAWTEVFTAHPDSAAAPSALDRVGTLAYPVEEFALRGQLAPGSLDQARPIFERIASNYRASPEAARALFKLGLLFSDPAASYFDLDEAYARFSKLTALYPQSEYADEGLFGMAEVLAGQRQWSRALVPISMLLAEAPTSALADQAIFLKGICLSRAGDRAEAVRTFQSLRDEIPDSPYAGLARDRNTHLVRLLEAGNHEGRTLYDRVRLVQPGLAPEWRIRAVASMAADADHQIAIADRRLDVIHILAADGTLVSRTEVRQPSAVWMGTNGLVAASRTELVEGGRRIPLVAAGGGERVGDVGFVARDSWGRYIVWDRKSGDILRFTREVTLESVLVEGRDQRIDAVALSEDGSLHLLDARERAVQTITPDGETRRVSLALEDTLRRPDRLAVDFLGNLFVMDTSGRTIGVFEPGGRVLATIASGKDEGEPFPRPAAMTVNGRGEILVYDERRSGIVVVR
jgi:TolA-binding protein